MALTRKPKAGEILTYKARAGLQRFVVRRVEETRNGADTCAMAYVTDEQGRQTMVVWKIDGKLNDLFTIEGAGR